MGYIHSSKTWLKWQFSQTTAEIMTLLSSYRLEKIWALLHIQVLISVNLAIKGVSSRMHENFEFF